MKAVGQIEMNNATKDELLKGNIDKLGRKEGRTYEVAEVLGQTQSAKSLGKMQTMQTRATLQNTLNE